MKETVLLTILALLVAIGLTVIVTRWILRVNKIVELLEAINEKLAALPKEPPF